ncbi:protein EURL homolog isoform X1 [Oryzias latipes]|uniref:protein EURL homolog isoform X1 n=1 Tax=Oryzias latipes TaxID=8090 RepID=UPI0009DB1B68|nr:protein EURL homolog isoform X1 [Oryzias latipes]
MVRSAWTPQRSCSFSGFNRDARLRLLLGSPQWASKTEVSTQNKRNGSLSGQRTNMDEEETFVSIDLNDDNICSVCKEETETGTLSFCHICFELSIEGVSTTVLLHSKSLRGHRDCFEKCHLIANQKLSHSKVSQSAYEGLKLALSQKLNRIIRFAQNKDAVSSSGCTKRGARFLCYSPHGDCKLLPQSEAQVPRYTPRWDWAKATGLPECTEGMLGEQPAEELELLQESQPDAWSSAGRTDLRRQIQSSGGQLQHRQQHHSREKLIQMSTDELHLLSSQLLKQIQNVFEQLTAAVQEKDALASELRVRHIAIEQLFKNCAKVPWLQISRAGFKAGGSSSSSSSSSSCPVE